MIEPARRPACAACLRPLRTCICGHIVATAHQAEVLILQHPEEVREAKGSARLLHLSLGRSRLEIGERFDEPRLRAWLAGATPILLYPTPPQMAPPPPLVLPEDPRSVRLVVLDATWRKSLKMLFLNPLLQGLPRLALEQPPPSRYAIRKARRPGQLSTLEAACHALAQIERDAMRYRPLLAAFDAFVAQQRAFLPSQP